MLSATLAQAQTPAPPPAATTGLSPVLVTATRSQLTPLDTPAAVDVVEGSYLRDDTLQVNLSEKLGHVPGLQIQNRQNYAQDLQISVRGFGARSTFGVRGVRLYVDGIPATMPDGQGQTSNIAISSADRVEVLRGPFSALYGNASGGVILVETQDGAGPPRLQGSFATGSNRTWRYGVQASGSTGALDSLIDVSRFTTDGYRDHSSARKTLANVRLGLALDDDSRLTIIGNHVDLFAQDPLGLTRAQFDTDPRAATLAQQYDTRKTVRQSQGGLVYERAIGSQHTFTAMVYHGRRTMQQFQSMPPAAQQNPGHAGGVIDLTRRYSGVDLRWRSEGMLAERPFHVVVGINHDRLHEQRRGFENYLGPASAPTALGVQGRLRRDETNRIDNLDPYLQAGWQLAERWHIEAGLRVSRVRFRADDHYVTATNGDDSGKTRHSRALPMLALRHDLTPSTRLYAAYGRGMETPTANEVAYRPDGQPGLNLALQPAVSDNVEIGAKHETAAGLLALAAFHTRTRDEIVSAGSSNGRTSFRNAGQTRRQGLEASWQNDWYTHGRVQLAYTWIDATYRETLPGTAIAAGNRIPGIARQSAFASLAWAPPVGWRASVEGRYIGRIAVDDSNRDYAPGAVIAALSTGYRWQHAGWETEAFARLDNVFDRRYAGSVIVNEGNQRYFEPAPGRNWSVGLTVAYRWL